MIRRFFSQSWLYHKARTSAFDPAEFLFFDTGYPVITLIFYCLLASYAFQTTDLTQWIIGNSFLMCVNTCVFGLGSAFTSERQSGRLRSILASPCNPLGVVLSCGFLPALTSMVSVAFGFFIGAAVFHVDFSNVNLWLAILVILCAMISASCFGMLLSVLGLLTDSMHLVLNILNYVLMIFTGAEFPVSQLPLPGQFFSRLLPLTRSIDAMNLLFTDTSGRFYRLILGELGMALLYAFGAVRILKKAERTCCRSGKFDLF